MEDNKRIGDYEYMHPKVREAIQKHISDTMKDKPAVQIDTKLDKLTNKNLFEFKLIKANETLNKHPFMKKYFKVICIGQLYRIGNWYIGANSKEQVQALANNRGTYPTLDEIEMVSGSLDHIIGESDNYDDVINMNDKIEKL